jgi:hypothetical protein
MPAFSKTTESIVALQSEGSTTLNRSTTGLEADFLAPVGILIALNTEQKLAKRNSYIMTLPVPSGAYNGALVGIGGWMIMTEDFSIGLFMALQLLITNFNTPVLQMSQLGEYVQTAKIDMARIDDVMKIRRMRY